MSLESDNRAWNNFIMHSDPVSSSIDGAKRAAAIANMFMGGANNGGINSFLTATHEVGSQEVLDALSSVGARVAASQLAEVLDALGEQLPRSSADDRWRALDRLWTEDLDVHDVLEARADAELVRVLEHHVRENEAYYRALDCGDP